MTSGDNLQEVFKDKIKRVRFDRTIGLFGATTLGVGALMGAGVYVLIGLAANAAGPSVVLSYLLCGMLAFITTLMYAELSRIIPSSGGGYIYAYDTLGGLAGFATGWFLALGSIFACGLYAVGFAEYAISITGLDVPRYLVRFIAIGATFLLGYLSIRPSKGKFNIQSWMIWGNLGILLVLIIFSFFQADVQHIQPAFPKGFGGTTAAISIIYISFFGYQLIANNADEIIDPERTVPRAMKLSMLISITFYLLVAIVAVLAVPWQVLGADSAPLVVLANKSFGGKGWLIISFGGVMASLGALSSTLVSQSRQIYVMGRHRFLPDLLGKLDEGTKRPKIALLTGASIVGVVLFLFDLEFIAKSANFCLLVSLLPVSLALRKIYLDNKEVTVKRWKRFLPEMALLANLGLLFTLDLVSLAFGQQLALIGAAVYFFYSRKREKRSRQGININLKAGKRFSLFQNNSILVPMANPSTQEALLNISNALLKKQGGEVVVLAIKDVPSGIDFYEALSDADETLEVIKRGIALAKSNNIKIRPVIRAARKIAGGIVLAAEEERSDLIVMGYGNHKDRKLNTMDVVMKHSNTDMVFLNLKTTVADFKPRNICLYIDRKSQIQLMLMVATALAEKHHAKITLLSYLSKGYTKKQKVKADRTIVEAIQKFNSTVLYQIILKEENDPLEDLINSSSNYDLLIVGKDRQKIKKKNIAETFAFQVAENAACSVIMVHGIKGLKKLINMI